MPSWVHPRNSTSATSSGLTHFTPRLAIAGILSAKDDAATPIGASVL
jgi:hypothetical protein